MSLVAGLVCIILLSSINCSGRSDLRGFKYFEEDINVNKEIVMRCVNCNSGCMYKLQMKGSLISLDFCFIIGKIKTLDSTNYSIKVN